MQQKIVFSLLVILAGYSAFAQNNTSYYSDTVPIGGSTGVAGKPDKIVIFKEINKPLKLLV